MFNSHVRSSVVGQGAVHKTSLVTIFLHPAVCSVSVCFYKPHCECLRNVSNAVWSGPEAVVLALIKTKCALWLIIGKPLHQLGESLSRVHVAE